MWDDDESEFCGCGVVLMGDPGETDDLCAVCAAAPHPGREYDGYPSCMCEECKAYWDGVSERSRKAAEEFNRRLVCSCGWRGCWPENHRERQAECEWVQLGEAFRV